MFWSTMNEDSLLSVLNNESPPMTRKETEKISNWLKQHSNFLVEFPKQKVSK